jgi:glycosyltransferase involved in cell wall biosynthesis
MKRISVCVPTYNRPETLRQLINSFLKQDYKNKELVISDDSTNNLVEKTVKSFNNESIKYYKNNPSLRFATNLITSIKRASGDYIVILGDDDVFFKNNVLTKYVKVFNKYPSVGFIYGNLVQFSNKLEIEYIITNFSKDTLYRKKEDAMENIWTRSIFIGGIGLRNTKDLPDMYPNKNILHPQVELVGNIINKSDAFGLADYSIGIRSHDDQIIFHALKNKKIREDGEHVNVELFKIFKKLKHSYRLSLGTAFLERQLLNQYYVMIFKEKSVLGNSFMDENYQKFKQLSPVANTSKKLYVLYVFASVLPRWSIRHLRNTALHIVRFRNMKAFNKYKYNLRDMIKH